MGNSPSSTQTPSRRVALPTPPAPYPYPPATVYTPGAPQMPYYQGGYNGQFAQGPGQPGFHQGPGQVNPPPSYAPTTQLSGPPRVQEYQRTATIRNQVNLKKSTLKLIPVDINKYAITFSFDASSACRVTTFVKAREDLKRGSKIVAAGEVAPAVAYGKGLDLKFPAADSSSMQQAHCIDLTLHQLKDLMEVPSGPADAVPVMIRLEALTDEGRAEGRDLSALDPGCELPMWVQSQTTYARVVKEEDGSLGLRVLKQKIWVKGESYELQEIYGMEQNRGVAMGTPAGPAAAAADGFEDVEGNECVICMSAPRDTAALPCRHMCMCHGCASALKTQTNKCPICRNEIESLLHIKINKTGEAPKPGVTLARNQQPAL